MKNLRKFVGLIFLTMVVAHLAGCETTTPLASPPQLTQEDIILLPVTLGGAIVLPGGGMEQ